MRAVVVNVRPKPVTRQRRELAELGKQIAYHAVLLHVCVRVGDLEFANANFLDYIDKSKKYEIDRQDIYEDERSRWYKADVPTVEEVIAPTLMAYAKSLETEAAGR